MVIVGSGLSAMISAYVALQNGANVIILTKKLYNESEYTWQLHGGCSWKTHAFNMAINQEDLESYIQDTLAGSDYLANTDLVHTLCKKANHSVTFLEELGVNPAKDSTGATIRKPFGGNEVPRAVFIEDRLGFHITKALNEKLAKYLATKQLQIIAGVRVSDLETDNKFHTLFFMNTATNEEYKISTKSVIFADGGGASMYAPSAASLDKTCDGLNIALNNGIELVDMEFVQFPPTGIVSCNPVFNGGLFEESLRFAGATLHNKLNERFAFNYNEKGEQATRDKVSRAIFAEIQQGAGVENAVELDITHCKPIILNEYPALLERIWQSGYDIQQKNRILVKPVAHFLMGGVKINNDCTTTINGVYFVGESAGGGSWSESLRGQWFNRSYCLWSNCWAYCYS